MSMLRVYRSVGRALAFFVLMFLIAPAIIHDYALADEGESIVVSFGDSYSSGEGNDPFYGQDSSNKYADEDWLAHRSKSSWPGRLRFNGITLNDVKYSQNQNIQTKGAKWFFYASSGAVAVNVYNAEPASDALKGEYRYAQSKTGRKHLVGEKFSGHIDIQLEEAKKDLAANGLSGNDVDCVTMSIGGNDIGFADIITNVAVRNGFVDRDYLFNALNDAWYNYDKEAPIRYSGTAANKFNLPIAEIQRKGENDESAKDQILQCYRSIRSEFPNADIVIAGYPTLLDDKKYDEYLKHKQGSGPINSILGFLNLIDLSADPSNIIGFADWEAWVINENARDFNRELESLINDNTDSSFRFVSVEEAFDGHESEYLYEVSLRPKLQDLVIGPSAGSVHPNKKGLQAYADAVQKEIDTLSETTTTTAIPEKIEHYASGEENRDSNQTATRDIAMVLDVSGSMAGDPLDATKNAASKFVNVALDNGAQTALVAYDDEADVLSEFTTGEASLKAAINKLSDGGGTNMESGLTAAQKLLKQEKADDQYIVLMSDGEPNDGKTGDELISYAKSIRDPDKDGKDDVKIYALGFNEGANGQALMRAIASDGCYTSVHDAGDLEDFFQDMVDSINGVKFMYARIACPVDVSVTFNGETLSSSGDTPQTRTSFGSLTFEEGESGQSDDPVKVLRLREGQSYDVSIVGTGQGTMDYSIGFIDDEGIYSDFRTFNGIEITDKTAIETTAEPSSSTSLAVDEDGDGAIDKTYRAGANEEGKLVDNSWIGRLVVAAFVLIALAVAGIVIWRKLKKYQQRVAHR